MNEVQVSLDDVGRVQLRRAGGDEGVYTLETTEALREYFQAERDEALGRWRDPENPNIVVYALSMVDGEDRCIRLLNELSGATWLDWGRVALPGPASRYFDAHPQPEPKPKPLEAEHEEIWVITANGDTGPALATTSHRRGTDLAFQTANGTLLDATEITAGRRIWPEPRIGGAE